MLVLSFMEDVNSYGGDARLYRYCTSSTSASVVLNGKPAQSKTRCPTFLVFFPEEVYST